MNHDDDQTNAVGELSCTQIQEVLGQYINDKIEEYEQFALTQDQVEIPPTERYIAGMYVREITIPKGTILTGRVWKDGYVDIMVSGDISVATPDGIKRLKGWNVLEGKAGRKRAGYTHEDTHWITVHKSNVREEQDALEELTFFQMKDYEHYRISEDRRSFDNLLSSLNLTDEQIQSKVQNKNDMMDLPETVLDLVSVKPSKIHGHGMFSEMPINKGEHIATAATAGLRTIAGRYVNHSSSPNAEMKRHESGDIDLYSTRSISAGEEITTDYEHTMYIPEDQI